MSFLILLAFGIYFCALIAVGSYFYHRDQSTADFMVGNRSVNYWVTAIATQASDMGSWLFLGFPAMIFTIGIFQAWTAIGLVLGMLSTWHFVAPKLREKSEEYKSLTLASYLAHRFQDNSGAIRIAYTIASLFFFVFYIASGLVGLSLLFESALGISYHTGIFLSLTTAVAYTLIGGFVAVAWCDFFQGLFLLATLMIIPTLGIIKIGGIQQMFANIAAKGISLSLIRSPQDTFNAIILAAGWGLGYFGQPHIITNFLGIDSAKTVKYAKRVGITWQTLVLSSSTLVGIVGVAFFAHPLANNELVFIELAQSLLHPLLAGFAMCAILAATLSTIDSLILVSGTLIGQDIYKTFINPVARAPQILNISRLGSIAVSLVALKVAWDNTQSINDLVNYAWAGLGSSFGPIILASLYMKNVTRAAALAGIIGGGITSAIWPSFGTSILPLVPGFLVSFALILLTSFVKNTKN